MSCDRTLPPYICRHPIFVWITCLIKNVSVSKMLPNGSTAFLYDLHEMTLFTFFRSTNPAEHETFRVGSLDAVGQV